MVAQLLLGGISPLLPQTFLASISPAQRVWGSSQLFPPPSPAAAVSLPPRHPAGMVSYVSGKAARVHWSMVRSKNGQHATSANGLAPHNAGSTRGVKPLREEGATCPAPPVLLEGSGRSRGTPIISVSDVSEQKALKTAERPRKKGFRESAHIHGLKCSSSENHQPTPRSHCHESHGNASGVVCAGVPLSLIPCRLKDE